MNLQTTSYSNTMVFEGDKANFAVILLGLDGQPVGSLTCIPKHDFVSYGAVNKPKKIENKC